MLTVLHGDDVVSMLFRKHFAILDGLNGGVEMILVNFTIDGCSSLFMAVLGDSLLSDSGSNSLVDGGVMVTSFVPEEKAKVSIIVGLIYFL